MLVNYEVVERNLGGRSIEINDEVVNRYSVQCYLGSRLHAFSKLYASFMLYYAYADEAVFSYKCIIEHFLKDIVSSSVKYDNDKVAYDAGYIVIMLMLYGHKYSVMERTVFKFPALDDGFLNWFYDLITADYKSGLLGYGVDEYMSVHTNAFKQMWERESTD